MEPIPHLPIFAEVSIGVTAMSAIVVVLRQKDTGEPRFRWILGLLFSWSIGGAVLSLLPIVISQSGMDAERLWRVSLAVMAGHGIVNFAGSAVADLNLYRRGIDMYGGTRPDKNIFRWDIAAAYTAVGIFSATTFWASVANPVPVIYFAGLLLEIVFAVWTLVAYLFYYHAEIAT